MIFNTLASETAKCDDIFTPSHPGGREKGRGVTHCRLPVPRFQMEKCNFVLQNTS
jgi:hypothetical protein